MQNLRNSLRSKFGREFIVNLVFMVFFFVVMIGAGMNCNIENGLFEIHNIIFVVAVFCELFLIANNLPLAFTEKNTTRRRIAVDIVLMIIPILCIYWIWDSGFARAIYYTPYSDKVLAFLTDAKKGITLAVIATMIGLLYKHCRTLYKGFINPICEGDEITFDGESCKVIKVTLFYVQLEFAAGTENKTYKEVFGARILKKAPVAQVGTP